jgi:predicted AAA+ superfamily ATPase
MPYLPRLLDRAVADTMSPVDGVPAVLIVGPRGSGKTTTAGRHAGSTLRLDRPTERGVVDADPDAAISVGDRPLLIDEWQLAPDVLGAVKRAVDRDFTAGQFLLTGSARSDLLATGWAGTGRIVRLEMWGLTQRELEGRGADPATLLDAALDLEADMPSVVDAPDFRAYVARALRGGLPQVATSDSAVRRARLLDAYVDQLVTRDVELSGSRRNPALLRTALRAVAASSGGIPAVERLVEATGLDRATIDAYDGVFEALMVTERVPAYVGNRLNRIARRPKRYITEPSLLGPLLGIDERAATRDIDVLGRLLDTYVAAQLRPLLQLTVPRARLMHLRDANGEHEVDLIVDYPDGSVIACEVKASAAPDRSAARHMRWLADRIGPLFRRGIVFHTGPRSFQYDDDIWYLPIAAL